MNSLRNENVRKTLCLLYPVAHFSQILKKCFLLAFLSSLFTQ